MLELLNVSSFYGNTPILHDISFNIPDGDLACVVGRNGVGKTTLANTIMGLTTRMEGTLKLNGVDASATPTHKRALAGIGYVPQGRGILQKLTVRENIVLGTFARKDRVNKVPDKVLDLFPYLAQNLEKRAGILSGGEAQQLAIARALASDPTLLILDEPTEGIQPNIVAQIEKLIQHLNKELKMTVMLIEQHVQFAKTVANSFVIMDRGAIVHKGPIEELTDDLIERYMTIR
jgi:urea transport system ATP-binding protein